MSAQRRSRLKLAGLLFALGIARVNYVDTNISLIARTFMTLPYDKFSLQRREIKRSQWSHTETSVYFVVNIILCTWNSRIIFSEPENKA